MGQLLVALQTLHTITIDDLAFSNPDLHAEYLNLVNLLIELIRELGNCNNSLLRSTSLDEKYDTNTSEAYLDLAISDGIESYYSRIYIHKNQKFIVETNGSGKSAVTAEDVMNLICQKVSQLNFVK